MSENIIKIIAPGRVCLFGEHQDYLGLPVIACAINRFIKIIATPNHTKQFALDMQDIKEKRFIAISDPFENLQKRDYFGAALRVLKRKGCIPDKGYDLQITGNIPMNSGTSSSSALLLAWIRFLIAAFGISEKISPEKIAYMAYESEVLEHKEPGGMMDHYAIGVGNVLHIKTKNPFQCKKIGQDIPGLITGVSGIKKDTVGLIGTLKKHSLEAIEKIKKQIPNFHLENVKIQDIEKYAKFLNEIEKPYFEAAITSHHYTKLALKIFQNEKIDWQKIGDYMNAHHQVLKNLLKITIPLIDAMIQAALEAGAYGAKIVGSGRGGSIVVIAPSEKLPNINKAIINAGAKDSYTVKVSEGVQLLNLKTKFKK